MQPRHVPFLTKLFWGIGQIGDGVKTAAFNSFLLFYYNQILGVSASLTSAALAIAILCDAVTDPLIGSLSDKFRSRWGRRHPFMLASAAPMAISMFLLFSPPSDMTEMFYFGWILAFAVSVRAFMTLHQIPHLALGAEMVTDYAERSTLFSFGLLFLALSLGGFTPAMLVLVFPPDPNLPQGLYNEAGYPIMAACAAVIAFVSILLSVWGTRKEIPFLSQPEKTVAKLNARQLIGEVKQAFANQSYRSIFFGLILGTIVLAIESIFLPFMGTHFWALETDQIGLISISGLLGLPFGLLLAVYLPRYVDKKWCLIVPAGISIVNGNLLIVLRLLEILPANGHALIVPMLAASIVVTAIITPVVFTTINSMFADIVDEMELESGVRQEGIVFSAREFANKCANGLGILLGGLALDFIAFPKSSIPGGVDAEVIFNLGLVQGPLTSIFTFGGLILYLGYRLSRERHQDIVLQLRARNTDLENTL